MTEICIQPIDDKRAKLIDCSTGKEIDLCELIANRCGGRAKAGAKARGKRAPSAYNQFIGSCVRGKTGAITERFKACVEEWKKRK